MTSQQMLAKLKYMEAEIQAMIKLVELDMELEAGAKTEEVQPKPKKRTTKKESEIETLQKEFTTICKGLAPDGQKKAVRIIREVNLDAKGVKDLTLDQLKEIMPDIRNLKDEFSLES